MGRLRGTRRWAALVTLVALVALVVATAAVVTAAGAGSTVPITAGGIQAQQPSVSGSRVVWSDYRAGQWDIWLYDAAVKRARKLTTGPGDKVQPAISGDTVVYVAYSATTKGDVFAYDIPSKTTRLVSADWQGLPSSGDQLNPTIGGAWVAWEDHSSAYNNGKINALNLVSGASVQVAASTTYQYRRPKIGGTVLTYERVLEKNIVGYVRGQSDVLYADLATAPAAGPIESAPLAETAADERLASTEGDWAAWMEFTAANGFDIKAKNLGTGETKWVVTRPGEQAVPVVANGVVYWIDTTRGVRIESMNLDTGAKASFPYRTRTDIAGLTGSGNALAWLQPIDGRWSVKVLLGAPVPGFDLAGLLAVKPAWSAFRFATTSTGGDLVAPRVVSASIEPGDSTVDPGDPFIVTFSEKMDARSVNSDSVQLVESVSGDVVEAEVSYSPLSKTATIDPAERLDGSYVLKVSSAVSDRAGNAAADDFAVSFATAGAEFVAAVAPSRVSAPTVRIVSATGHVSLTWTSGADGDGDLVGYQVKRFTTPSMDPATFSAATTLTPVSGPMTIVSTSATFAPAADELDLTSTYYYAVVGVDAAGNFSQTWYNISPNPHATEISGMNTNSCLRCHSIHGAASGGMLGARAATGCYKCHGSTDQATTYGYNSVNNIQAEFFDYPYTNLDPSPPSEPSRHGNSYVRANVDNNQCVMCHAPHKRSFNDSEAISYRKLLKRSQVATDASSTPVVYSTDAAPMGKVLCYNCHGTGGDELTPGSAPYTNMYYYGGPQAFANTAGDHNQASWDLVGASAPAHGTQNVNDAARPLATGGSLPSNACQVCHAEHGSESASLLAYRRSSDTTQLARTGGLCLECHGAGAEAGSPNTWNARNVANEFGRSGSAHPNQGSYVPSVPQAGNWMQSTDLDFSADTLTSTEVNGTGAAATVRLAYTAPQTGITAGRVPTSDIAAGSWTTAALWSKVDEYPTANDGDYVVGAGTTEAQFGMTAFAVPSNATNITVSVRTRARDATAGTNNYFARWRTGSTWRSLPTHDPAGTTWTNYTDSIAEPGNGVWTPAEVNAINGLGLDTSDASPNPWVSQLYIEVRYDLPATYATSGSVVSPVIASSGTLNSWTELRANGSVPANTGLVFDVLDPQAADAPIVGYTDITLGQMPFSLSALNVATYPTLKVQARLTGDGTVTSLLDDWTVTYTSTPALSTATTTCYNCHNAHYVAEGAAATAWQMSRVSDPLDTNGVFAGTSTGFCMQCHGATGHNAGTGAIAIAAVTNSANTLIPYPIGMSATTSWPFFTGWNKSDFTNAGHYTVSAANGKALCENCHDPHASDFKSLTAWTRPSGATITGGNTGTRDNTTVSTVKEENLCYQCHGDGSTANKGKAAGAVNIYTAAQSTYRHTIATTDAHSSSEDASDLLASRHAECADCHDPHSARPGVHTVKSSAAGAVLRGVTGVRPTAWPANWTSVASGNWTTEKFDGAATDYESYLCFKCHSSHLDPSGYGTTAPMTISTNTNGSTYRQTDLALEFNPNNQSGHNVVGTAVFPKTTTASGLPYTFGAADLNLNTALGWDDVNTNTNKMTCSDCHSYDGTGARGPHGSGSKFIVDAYAAGQTANWYTTTLSGWGTSNFLCRKCHTTMTSNVTHNRSSHSGYQCQRCHVRIPHGWKRPRLLRRANFDAMPYSDPTVTGLTAIEYQNYAGDVQEADCSDNCGQHTSAATTWP